MKAVCLYTISICYSSTENQNRAVNLEFEMYTSVRNEAFQHLARVSLLLLVVRGSLGVHVRARARVCA